MLEMGLCVKIDTYKRTQVVEDSILGHKSPFGAEIDPMCLKLRPKEYFMEAKGKLAEIR